MAVTYAEGRIKMTAQGDVSEEGHFLIKSITWANVADGQELLLNDQDVNNIWGAIAENKNNEMEKIFVPPLQVQKIELTILSIGTMQKPNISTVLIYI